MGWNRFCLDLLLALLLLAGLCCTCSASTFISDDILESHASSGRNLLQAKHACPVNFEFMNYTVLTSQCRGPKFPASSCCAAFKEFACPYSDQINDLTNDCATTMFSYINLNGKYPAGLFSSLCREGKSGLECPASSPTESASANGSEITRYSSSLLMLATAFLVLMRMF